METVEVPPARTGPETVVTETVTTDFVECYLQHYGRLVRAMKLSGADPGTAEEVAQEAFARALGRWRRVSRGGNPPGYVYTTAFRVLRRNLERQARWDIGDPPEPAPHPQSALESTATTRVALEALLAGMPPKRRACAVMCLVVGLSPREAGETLGIADGTVRKHLDAARQDLACLRE